MSRKMLSEHEMASVHVWDVRTIKTAEEIKKSVETLIEDMNNPMPVPSHKDPFIHLQETLSSMSSAIIILTADIHQRKREYNEQVIKSLTRELKHWRDQANELSKK